MPLSVCLLPARLSPSLPPLPSSPASFPLLLVFVAALVAAVPVPVVGRVVEKHLVKSFERLGEVVLEGGKRGADGGRAKAVRDEGEVGEAALYAGFQDGARPRVAQGSPVLGQQVCELLTELSAGEKTQDIRRELLHICSFNNYIIVHIKLKTIKIQTRETHNLNCNFLHLQL